MHPAKHVEKQIYRHCNCVRGINAAGGGQLGKKESNTNFPVLCTSNKLVFLSSAFLRYDLRNIGLKSVLVPVLFSLKGLNFSFETLFEIFC